MISFNKTILKDQLIFAFRNIYKFVLKETLSLLFTLYI